LMFAAIEGAISAIEMPMTSQMFKLLESLVSEPCILFLLNKYTAVSHDTLVRTDYSLSDSEKP